MIHKILENKNNKASWYSMFTFSIFLVKIQQKIDQVESKKR